MIDTRIIPQKIIIISDALDVSKQQALSSKFREIEKTQPMHAYQPNTIIDRAARGEVSMDRIHDLISNEAERWNYSDTKTSLHEFLGMTWDEYASYITNPLQNIKRIIDSHAKIPTDRTQPIEIPSEFITLYVPINSAEHQYLRLSNYTRFTKQKEYTFFYPYLDEKRAVQVAQDNTTVGFVAKFRIKRKVICMYNLYCGHYNVPMSHLDLMNNAIDGQIQIVHTFFGQFSGK